MSIAGQVRGELKVGAAITDVTPATLPVLVNGGMLSRQVGEIHTRLYARAIALDDGETRIALVVVDSCMIPRPLLDEAKQLASQRTKIRPDRIMISATHTHTAPSSLACLGTDADPAYVPYLREKLAQAVAAAEANLQPAQVGWGAIDAAEYTALRRWIRRPDRIAVDPFGNATMRAQMHSGRVWDDVVGESGPEDPELSMLAFRSLEGQPLAVLCNFSMHYFGDRALSSDYFGIFCGAMESAIGSASAEKTPPFMAAMAHGCSGDIWRRDYKVPASERNDSQKIDEYAKGLAELAMKAYVNIEYDDDADLAMEEARFVLNYRTPNTQMLQWARQIVEKMGDRAPKDTTEVYAREQLILHERQSTEIVLQGIRIGDFGIATTPNETYALTGLKIKLQSPLKQTMVVELANGGDGYIPPPEQHLFGGYNTWPARSAGLEVQAEPKIAEACVALLERVANKPRKRWRQTNGPASTAVLDAKPRAYWRLDEWAGPRAVDASEHRHDAIYEAHVAYFLDGPRSKSYCGASEPNRSVHFVGGRLRSRFADLGDKYSVAFWFWNGLPFDARPVAGWMFSRGEDFGLGASGDHLGLGGADESGKLIFRTADRAGKESVEVGTTAVARWTWNHVVLVRDGNRVRVHLNGAEAPEIDAMMPNEDAGQLPEIFLGGRSDRKDNWEGRLDEVAVFDRALSVEQIKRLFPTD